MEAIAKALYEALKMLPCSCTRQFPYNGKGKVMCRRCQAMVMYEKEVSFLATGNRKSETERTFMAHMP